jgi:hypothetical protein
MFEKEYLTPSEKISAFLDGELPQEDVQSLFYEIASDSELQDELRTLVSVKEMTKSSLIMPPPALKTNIDAGLGLIDSTPAAVATSSGRGLVPFLNNKFFLSGMAALFSALLTYFIMLPEENMVANSQISKTEITQNTEANSTKKNAAFPVVSSFESSNSTENLNNSGNNVTNRIVYINTPLKSDSDIITDSDLVFEENQTSESELDNSLSEIFISNPVNSDFSMDFELQNSKYKYNKPLSNKKAPLEILEKFYLEMKYNQGRSYPDLNIPVEAEPIINNVAIGLFYRYNENNSIGIEFGQENYYQRYFFKEGDLVKRYEQNWMAFWGGLTYNYDFGKVDFVAPLHPYYRFMIGGTQIGPLFKSSIGAKLPVSDKLYFVLAAEGSYLVYHFQGRSYSSSRVGLSLGMSFGL